MNDRVALRQLIRTKRQQLTASTQKQQAELLLQKLKHHPKIQSAQHIALYLTNDGELDLTPFISWCWQQEKSVYLPVIHPFTSGHLLFLRYRKNTIMIKNKFGIAEPKLDVTQICPIQQLDIICTPLVAFDKTGARLGMGGGFYDRTLSHWQHQASPYPIGLAHDCQQVEKIPLEVWDIPLPEIITPSKNFVFD